MGVEVAEIVPVDQFLEWYPGWTPELTASPWVAEQSGPFTKEDEERFWFIDFHWPRGFSPMGYLYVTDCAAWGTQTAAHWLPLPPGKGLVAPHGRAVPVRVARCPTPRRGSSASGPPASSARCRGSSRTSTPSGRSASGSWSSASGTSRATTSTGRSLAELGQYLADARSFHRRAWEIHFEIMYPLLAIYLQLYGLCASNGIDPANISKFLQGRDSKIMETDRAMWELVAEASRLGVADLFATAPEQIRDQLAKAGGNASVWLTKFDDFLKVYGWRTEGIADANLPPWIEDPVSPLGQIRNFLAMEEPHDFEQRGGRRPGRTGRSRGIGPRPAVR